MYLSAHFQSLEGQLTAWEVTDDLARLSANTGVP